uniref:Transposase (Putative), gypsy type n=1 Tax=Tanacetum cinerariifolium TaxID=118510 RepID=A0A6L2MK07_TANCI|nr:hypothetical protein [Tanacetum cinerariifolium]
MSLDWTPVLELVSRPTIWVMRRGFSNYPVDNSVVIVWTTSLGSDTQLRMDRDPCGCGLLLVTQCSCEAVLCGYGSRLVLGHFRTLPIAGLEPVVCCLVGLRFRIVLYVIMSSQSSMFFVRTENITRLKYAACYVLRLVSVERSQRRVPTTCCFSKKFDPLKGWNDHFFWIDANNCPIYVPWYNDVFVRRDPLPFDNLVGFELLEKLDSNRTYVVVALSVQTVRLVDHNIINELDEHVGKKKRKVVFDALPVKKACTGGIVILSQCLLLLVKSHLLHVDVEVENIRNVAAAFADGAKTSSIPSGDVGASDSNVYVPKWNITNDARVDNHALCRNPLDHITSFGYWAALRNQTDARERFQKRFTESYMVIQQRDAEIVDFKAKLERSEGENAELLGKVSALELVCEELNGKVSQLTTDCDGLQGEVVGEAKMREEFVCQQDAAACRFDEWAAELDARIVDVRRDMDTDLYPHMLTAIAGRRWVVRHGFHLAVYKCARFVDCRAALGKVISMAINKGIQQGLEDGTEHGKASRSLSQVEAYDPGTEGKYVAAVTDPIYSESGSISREMLLLEAIPAIRGSAKRRGLCSPSGFASGGASALISL